MAIVDIVQEYLNDKLEVVQAIRLTHENADLVSMWCGGDKVITYDALDKPGEPDAKSEVGVNFMAREEWERLSEGQYLVKRDMIFYKMSTLEFNFKHDVI